MPQLTGIPIEDFLNYEFQPSNLFEFEIPALSNQIGYSDFIKNITSVTLPLSQIEVEELPSGIKKYMKFKAEGPVTLTIREVKTSGNTNFPIYWFLKNWLNTYFNYNDKVFINNPNNYSAYLNFFSWNANIVNQTNERTTIEYTRTLVKQFKYDDIRPVGFNPLSISLDSGTPLEWGFDFAFDQYYGINDPDKIESSSNSMLDKVTYTY